MVYPKVICLVSRFLLYLNLSKSQYILSFTCDKPTQHNRRTHNVNPKLSCKKVFWRYLFFKKGNKSLIYTLTIIPIYRRARDVHKNFPARKVFGATFFQKR